MLNEKQIGKIKEHLEKAQNPIFLFDNDVDGLCSFALLRRYCKKGKAFPAKTFPSVGMIEFGKVEEFNSDYIFILDKPLVSKEFFDEARKFNLPIVWIDHHEIPKNIPDFVNYYNPLLNEKKENLKDAVGEPTTFLCYQISQTKSDLWLAVIGSISDGFIPDYYSEFLEKYKDLGIKAKTAFDIRFGSQLGKIIRILSFALKDRVRNVVSMIKFLVDVKNPYEILQENDENYEMHKRFNEIDSKYKILIEKAKNQFDASKKLFFFKYGGNLSISSDLANNLYYNFPDKYIIVAYDSGVKLNISGRGKNVRELIAKALSGLKNSTSGGHREAVGAKILSGDADKLKEKLEMLVREENQ
jgi:single-stranded DNA-specific DHH superfamily exonuclease